MKNPPEEKEVKHPSRTWRKKYPCKKNKGDHTFCIESVRGFMEYRRQTKYGTAYGFSKYHQPGVPPEDTGMYIVVNWYCTACNKKEVERYGKWFNDRLTKKLDKYRHTMYTPCG
jgi:hypothetical protein